MDNKSMQQCSLIREKPHIQYMVEQKVKDYNKAIHAFCETLCGEDHVDCFSCKTLEKFKRKIM